MSDYTEDPLLNFSVSSFYSINALTSMSNVYNGIFGISSLILHCNALCCTIIVILSLKKIMQYIKLVLYILMQR